MTPKDNNRVSYDAKNDGPGYEQGDLSGFPDGAVTTLQVPALAISSSDCRARVQSGLPVYYLVPDGVVQYIDKRHLYLAPP